MPYILLPWADNSCTKKGFYQIVSTDDVNRMVGLIKDVHYSITWDSY